jgi:putative Mg2+ transporter-C (MgtC) family protein
MPLHPSWGDIALRLVLTMIAGSLIGLDRGARGHAAGLRTTILVGLAASVAMIQANILLPVGGKAADSFGVMDLMRLPLGILTGVGFIGGGAILRRGDLVTGVTTAATLWMMTVIGLCLGGGQLALGSAATVLALITLWAMRWLDQRIPRKQHAMLVLEAGQNAATIPGMIDAMAALGFAAELRRWDRSDDTQHMRLWFELSWTQQETAGPPIDLLKTAQNDFAIVSFELTSEAHH